MEKERRFKDKYALPFTLIADPAHAVAEAYGAWQLKSMLGKSYHGVVRTTYLIDPQGVVARVFGKVKAEGHAAQVREALEELRA